MMMIPNVHLRFSKNHCFFSFSVLVLFGLDDLEDGGASDSEEFIDLINNVNRKEFL